MHQCIYMGDDEFFRMAKAVADPQRCEILQRAAAAGEMSCAIICARCAVTQATVSHHLKELVTAGLLERQRRGQFAYYRFRADRMEAYTVELTRRMKLRKRA